MAISEYTPMGIVQKIGKPYEDEEMSPFFAETKAPTAREAITGTVSSIRRQGLPGAISEAISNMPKYQGIVNEAKEKTSDDLINRWLASAQTGQYQYGITPPVAPATPAPVAPAPSIVSTAPSASTDNDLDRMSRAWQESGGILLRQPDGSITFQARNQGNAEYEALQLRKDLGLAPKTGMEEYEASAARTRGIVTHPSVRAAQIGAVAEIAKASAANQAKIYESAMKSNEEWAKLGIQSQDVQSKMKYRQSQVDDLMTRTGLLEPMKIQLAQAKTSADQTKVKRDFAMHALDKLKEDQINEYRDTTMKMGGQTPEQQQKFNQIESNYQAGVDNIMSMYPLEGDVRKFGDRVAKFVNGKYIDITDQVKGIVGGQ